MRVQTDFKNKTCLNVLNTSFLGEKYPLFPLKKMSRDRVLNHHIMTSLYLTLFPGMLCFGYKNVSKCSH